MLPGPGSLTEPILLHVPLASPGPRHPAGPSALQPQRSTAARHSTPGPAPLLMHMQPYSGLYSHSQTHQQQTHTQTTTKETMRNGSLPPPFTQSTTGLDQKHSLITIHSHTVAHTCQLQPKTSNNSSQDFALASIRSAALFLPPKD